MIIWWPMDGGFRKVITPRLASGSKLMPTGRTFLTTGADFFSDEYMRDGGTYRYRRYSALEYDVADGIFRLLPRAPYEQSKAVNHLNGGFKRYFEPLEQSFIDHPVLNKILTDFCRILSDATRHDRWNIKLHPYRIVARDGVNGEPAPEGLHQDGVDIIVSYMIGRVNVTGGVSTVKDASKQFLGDVEMNLPNDFLICNNRTRFHDVSAVAIENPKMPFAYRDVLVIAFEKI
ncbi:2OG-Fe dioxygenase family protein [Rhizobium mongolense]|uniref:2OG-Fe dioxygenase family protein n=1 Tax=Rhizobium mongolense TaxID=57676 RepID=A0ABR6IZ42_9HYPH|nr:2OG-Fe dioxygenase family protein [Rhizobium mongolense]MBB4233152.1 hypothetical protein [Rhizobium mongolense]